MVSLPGAATGVQHRRQQMRVIGIARRVMMLLTDLLATVDLLLKSVELALTATAEMTVDVVDVRARSTRRAGITEVADESFEQNSRMYVMENNSSILYIITVLQY